MRIEFDPLGSNRNGKIKRAPFFKYLRDVLNCFSVAKIIDGISVSTQTKVLDGMQ